MIEIESDSVGASIVVADPDGGPPAMPPSPLKIRDFRLLWLGEAVSSLGDQFTIVALPWLALVMTGSALALGTVLAVMAIPRALLMLVGGVFVDRQSPRRMMIVANIVRLGAVVALGTIVLAGAVDLWMLYAFAATYGLADAMFFPAQNSIVPALVDECRLQQANGIVQGTGQLALFVGPMIAGLFVASFGMSADGRNLSGLGAALVVDGLSFACSLVTLWLIRGGSAGGSAGEPMINAIRAAIGFVWRSPTKRLVLLFVAAINLLVVGPFIIAVPLIAYDRLPEGAAAFGAILSAMGGGALVGMVAAGALPAPRPSLFGPTVLTVLATTGLCLVTLAFAASTLVAAAVAGAMGAASGYGNILLVTWMQRRIPRALMGRVISLIGLAATALVPVSQVVAGATVQVSLDGTLFVGGATLAVIAGASAVTPTARRMGLEPIVPQPDDFAQVSGLEGA